MGGVGLDLLEVNRTKLTTLRSRSGGWMTGWVCAPKGGAKFPSVDQTLDLQSSPSNLEAQQLSGYPCIQPQENLFCTTLQ